MPASPLTKRTYFRIIRVAKKDSKATEYDIINTATHGDYLSWRTVVFAVSGFVCLGAIA